eukprot:GHVT01064894.1.p1 GENE.GHVT01064894.1~~GHVT01064894.1.p1  ORF type:complete len:452 (-),score=149.98 GHVT01064894.1:235-1590(-)
MQALGSSTWGSSSADLGASARSRLRHLQQQVEGNLQKLSSLLSTFEQLSSSFASSSCPSVAASSSSPRPPPQASPPAGRSALAEASAGSGLASQCRVCSDEIQRQLAEASGLTQTLRCPPPSPSPASIACALRYESIFAALAKDHQVLDFRRKAATERAALLARVPSNSEPKEYGANGEDAIESAAHWRERSALDDSIRSIDALVSQGRRAQVRLQFQKLRIAGAVATLRVMASDALPAASRTIQRISSLKARQAAVLALFTAACILATFVLFNLQASSDPQRPQLQPGKGFRLEADEGGNSKGAGRKEPAASAAEPTASVRENKATLKHDAAPTEQGGSVGEPAVPGPPPAAAGPMEKSPDAHTARETAAARAAAAAGTAAVAEGSLALVTARQEEAGVPVSAAGGGALQATAHAAEKEAVEQQHLMMLALDKNLRSGPAQAGDAGSWNR